MNKINRLIFLLFCIWQLALIGLSSNCNINNSQKLSERQVKERLIKKHKVNKDWIKLDLIRTFPTEGEEKKGHFFLGPSDLALFDNKFVFIADANHQKIIKFSIQGTYLDEFGKMGQGPGDFYFPRKIDISNEDNLFVMDGNGKMQVFDIEGKHIRSFQVYFEVFDFLIGNNNSIYLNLIYGKQKETQPLIVRYDMNGKEIGSFGKRVDREGDWTRNSEIFMTRLGDEIIAAFVHYPKIQRFTSDGNLIKDIKINIDILNELEQYNYKKWFTHPAPSKISLPRLVAGVEVLNQRIFILLQLPRLEIIEMDIEGHLINHYYSPELKNAVSLWGFSVREEKQKLLFYVLQAYEEKKMFIFQVKKSAGNMYP